MKGKRVLVTGATTGIGRVTAVELGRMGAEVLLVARNREKASLASIFSSSSTLTNIRLGRSTL